MVNTAQVSIIVAVISLMGTVGAAIVVAYSTYMSNKLKNRTEAEATLSKYQDPLLLAALALRRKFHELLSDQGPGYDHTRRNVTEDYIIIYSAFLVGQFFCWIHILRTESQFLSVQRSHETVRDLTDAFFQIEEAWSAERGGRFKLWRGQQSGIGELMTDIENGQRSCTGYAAFRDRWYGHPEFKHWFGDFTHNPSGGSKRLKEVTRGLDILIALLDPSGDLIVLYCRVDSDHSRSVEIPRRPQPAAEKQNLFNGGSQKTLPRYQ